MKRIVTYWTCLFVLCLGEAAYGVRTEQIGPDKPDRPTISQPGWPKGIVDVPRHPSRVYSMEASGNENFYFKATPAEANEIVTAFSKARMRDHIVVIAAERKDVKPFNGGPIDYNVNLQVVAGIALFMVHEGRSTLPSEPQLTIFAGDNQALVGKVAWPKNVIIRNEVPGLAVPKGQTEPKRELYYGRLEFADGSPPSGFVEHVNSRVTLWDQQAELGFNVGDVNNAGYFSVALSKDEMADLKAGKTWLTVTFASAFTEARKTDQRIPADRLVRDKGQAKAFQVQGLPYYYGRILFEDGSPPVLDPLPWPGAEIRVSFPTAFTGVDSEGYFKVVFTEEEIEKMKARKPDMNIIVPDPLQKNRSRGMASFPVDLLSQDKAKAGVVKIPRPVAPKKELVEAESKIGKVIPSLDNIRFDRFEPNQAKDKPLLVCFWDLDQRSSRQCVESLQKQREALEKRGLVVLVIHGGSQPQEQVKDWLGKTSISLPSGTIQGDPHDVLLSWGAKGMPWLILTNTRHLVVKEGFTLDEFLEGR
jgi:hypothetical protein